MAAPPKKPAAKVRMRYDDADMTKPNPNGLFNDQGFQDRFSGQTTKITVATPANTVPQPTTDREKAAAQARLVAQGNADRARLAAAAAAKTAPFGATPLPAPPRVRIAVAMTRKRKK